jgi:hypothetical protein
MHTGSECGTLRLSMLSVLKQHSDDYVYLVALTLAAGASLRETPARRSRVASHRGVHSAVLRTCYLCEMKGLHTTAMPTYYTHGN